MGLGQFRGPPGGRTDLWLPQSDLHYRAWRVGSLWWRYRWFV